MNLNSVISSLSLVLAIVVCLTSAGYQSEAHGHYQPVYKQVDYYTRPKYSYAYGISDEKTGDHKSAQESRDGNVVTGSYSILQPDGIMRTVTYTADPWNGFQAKVHNEGYASHPPSYVTKVVPVAIKPVAIVKSVEITPQYTYRRSGYGY